jgi:hypothetical protein
LGKECRLQAFPEDWLLIKQVQSGELSGDLLQAVCLYLSWLRGKGPRTEPQAYFQQEDSPTRKLAFLQTLDLLVLDPGLLWRHCYLDRRFEVVRYLLTESTSDESSRRLFQWAIDGYLPIHPAATASQGYPIQWSDADTTGRIHEALCPVEFSSLAMHFGTDKYLAATLYKKSEDRREVRTLHSCFCELKEYYRVAAKTNCGTLVIVD